MDDTTTIRFVQKSAPQRYTLGVVYEPGAVDLQGHHATPETIEKACWDFNQRLQSGVSKSATRVIQAIAKALTTDEEVRVDVTALMDHVEKGAGLDDMHGEADPAIGDIVESYITRHPMMLGSESVQKGAWLMGTIWSPDYFEKVQTRKRTGLSLAGTAILVPDADA